MHFNAARHPRREFIKAAILVGACGLWLPRARAAAAPTNNPLAPLGLGWTEKLRWDAVVDITSLTGAGEFWDERLERAQQVFTAKGGGVVFFPRGGPAARPRSGR